mmetsp:Transcript_8502/g.25762  ORF Transcript_8502/g.25762 Transcript_8502/m.25762 type:complete len:200 (+) Transcript_8502:121-720(+)
MLNPTAGIQHALMCQPNHARQHVRCLGARAVVDTEARARQVMTAGRVASIQGVAGSHGWAHALQQVEPSLVQQWSASQRKCHEMGARCVRSQSKHFLPSGQHTFVILSVQCRPGAPVRHMTVPSALQGGARSRLAPWAAAPSVLKRRSPACQRANCRATTTSPAKHAPNRSKLHCCQAEEHAQLTRHNGLGMLSRKRVA